MQCTNKNTRYLTFLLIGIAIFVGMVPATAQDAVLADTLDTPYGAVSKERYLGAASTIYSDKLIQTLSPSLLPALTGRLPGLFIHQNNGALQHRTNASATSDLAGWIPVWGTGNYSDNSQFSIGLRNTSPVVLVDGVERELFLLDPETIESISVQKDALSSLLMGMKSARGMMVITTKKPQTTGLQLSFTARYGVEQPLNIP
ncbi:MAG: TonB-dependent receptor plug domain-containing protein, partial [Dysgonamonadaceae bacterium]|nr:TonB-dependent receptor plug domain-containing protein [Dysgonamonadaceae bacterium]